MWWARVSRAFPSKTKSLFSHLQGLHGSGYGKHWHHPCDFLLGDFFFCVVNEGEREFRERFLVCVVPKFWCKWHGLCLLNCHVSYVLRQQENLLHCEFQSAFHLLFQSPSACFRKRSAWLGSSCMNFFVSLLVNQFWHEKNALINRSTTNGTEVLALNPGCKHLRTFLHMLTIYWMGYQLDSWEGLKIPYLVKLFA